MFRDREPRRGRGLVAASVVLAISGGFLGLGQGRAEASPVVPCEPEPFGVSYLCPDNTEVTVNPNKAGTEATVGATSSEKTALVDRVPIPGGRVTVFERGSGAPVDVLLLGRNAKGITVSEQIDP